MSHKEEPNTPNVNAWPDGHQEEKLKRRKDTQTSELKVDWYLLWERAEFYVFLTIGSLLWYLLVFKLLDWHRFPYHNYTVEVCFIIAVPILLLAFLLAIMDRTFNSGQGKKND